jgi:hypothetical protein
MEVNYTGKNNATLKSVPAKSSPDLGENDRFF